MIPASPNLRTFCLLGMIFVAWITIWITVYGPHRNDLESTDITIDRIDYSQLIDLSGFAFNMFQDVCDSHPDLLILVPSAADHFRRREVIRETWGLNSDQVKTAFLLGEVRSDNHVEELDVARRLALENAKHKDLLQGNFADTYRNMTYKHVMALKYVSYHCPNARYVLKADDDVFVNTYALIKFLNDTFSKDDEVIFCKTKDSSRVSRRKSFKWAATVTEYPGKTYPPYCWGFAVVYSPGVMTKLYKSAQETKYFWIDDIHVTGTLAGMHNLSRTDASEHVFGPLVTDDIMKGAVVNDTLLFGYNLAEQMVQDLWKHLRKV